MLAYVFWHWPQSSITVTKYENDLIQFHQTLSLNKPQGFQRSIVFTTERAFWLKTEGTAYEEWYVLDDSAALDRLNHAAVNGPCEEPHNRVARNAADGTAGLYRLRLGGEQLDTTRVATWFSKPAGVPYPNFDAQMKTVIAEYSATLWARTMTLGPTTEFCLHGSEQIPLAAEFNARSFQLRTIWLGK